MLYFLMILSVFLFYPLPVSPVGFMEALDGWPPPVIRGLDFLSDTLFLIDRFMLPAEVPRAYSFAVPSRIVLWQHVGDLRPLSGITKEKWSACGGVRTRDPELVCSIASH